MSYEGLFWGYVESANNSQMTILEQGESFGCVKRNTIGYSWYGELTCFISPDFTGGGANLGDDFYGVILNTACWKPISQVENSDHIYLMHETGTANQKWHFVRQSDGAYVISSCKNGKALEMYNGDTSLCNHISTCSEFWGGYYQQWYLIPQGNGYVFLSKHYKDLNRVMDLKSNATDDGNVIQIYERNNSDAQIWSIYTGNEVQLKASTLSCTVNSSSVQFNISRVYGASAYNLKIWKNKVWDGDAAYTIWNSDLNTSINLPVGTYQAYVDTCDYFNYYMSNVVTFTISETFSLNELTICYDCYGGMTPTIDTSKGFYFGDYNRICTTQYNHKNTWWDTPNVYYETITEGNYIGGNGLHDFSAFGLSAPAGYKFVGWRSGDNGRIFDETTTTYTASDFTDDIKNEDTDVWLTAQFEPISSNVTFNANGGSCSTSSKTVTYNQKYGSLPTPTRTGYTFGGWYTSATGGNKITSSTNVAITSNQTLYAHWTPKTYTVSFDSNGGNCSTSSKTVTYNSTYGTLPTPTRSEYAFDGWFTSATGGTQITSSSSVAITANQTLFAHWTSTHPHQYTSTTKQATCTEDGTITYVCSCGDTYTETIPAKGHNFEDWIITVPATSNSEGLKEHTCKRCGIKETEVIPKLSEIKLIIPEKVEMDYKSELYLDRQIINHEHLSYSVSWSSSNPDVAEVDSYGNVKALKTGKTVITCTVTDENGKVFKDSCTVKVKYNLIQ